MAWMLTAERWWPAISGSSSSSKETICLSVVATGALPGKTRPDGALSTGDAAAGNRYDFCTGQSPMSEEQLKAFLEKVKTDASLQEKLKAAANADAVTAIAKEAGFSISADDLKNAQSELSDEELEGVAGGRNCTYGSLCIDLCTY